MELYYLGVRCTGVVCVTMQIIINKWIGIKIENNSIIVEVEQVLITRNVVLTQKESPNWWKTCSANAKNLSKSKTGFLYIKLFINIYIYRATFDLNFIHTLHCPLHIPLYLLVTIKRLCALPGISDALMHQFENLTYWAFISEAPSWSALKIVSDEWKKTKNGLHCDFFYKHNLFTLDNNVHHVWNTSLFWFIFALE